MVCYNVCRAKELVEGKELVVYEALRQMLRGYEMEGWLEGSHQKT